MVPLDDFLLIEGQASQPVACCAQPVPIIGMNRNLTQWRFPQLRGAPNRCRLFGGFAQLGVAPAQPAVDVGKGNPQLDVFGIVLKQLAATLRGLDQRVDAGRLRIIVDERPDRAGLNELAQHQTGLRRLGDGLAAGRNGLMPLVENARRTADQDQRQERRESRRNGIPPAPAPAAGERSDRAGQYGPTVLETLQVSRQRQGGRVAARRLLFQTLQADRFEVARHGRVEQARADRLGVQNLPKRLHCRIRPKRRPPGQELVQNRSQAVDIGTPVDDRRSRLGLLGGHVTGRAEHRTRMRVALRVQLLGQAEVGDLGDAILNRRLRSSSQQDIRRLEVAVDDSPLVGIVHGFGQNLDDRSGTPSRQWSAMEAVRQALAVDILQGDEGPSGRLADFVNLDDVGMLQPRHSPGFPVKALALFAGPVGPKHLQGHDAVETLLPGLEDDAHAAASGFFEQIVVAKTARGDLRWHGQRLFDKLVCLAEPF